MERVEKMVQMKRPRLQGIKVLKGKSSPGLVLEFVDGSTYTVDFAQWRARNGLSLANAAQALGTSTRTISAYGSGKRAVPRYMALACKDWSADQGQRTGN